jgi:hypothetical protein
MNNGIQDAHNLVWKMALVLRGRSPDSLLDSYTKERQPIAASTVFITELATRAVTLRIPVVQEIRNHFAKVVTGLEVVQARATRTASGIANNYRRSPLVGEHRASLLGTNVIADRSTELPSVHDWLDFSSAPHPGDRAPDVEYEPGARLFALTRGVAHQLLLFDGAAATPEGYANFRSILRTIDERYHGLIASRVIVPREAVPAELSDSASRVVLDRGGRLHARYGAGSECLYLLRPDGYVGFRSLPADEEALLGYLKRLLPGA